MSTLSGCPCDALPDEQRRAQNRRCEGPCARYHYWNACLANNMKCWSCRQIEEDSHKVRVYTTQRDGIVRIHCSPELWVQLKEYFNGVSVRERPPRRR